MKADRFVYGAVAALLCGCGNAALAAATTAAPSAVPDTAPDATAADTADNGIGEITVTAQRRNESIQKVPLTIQAFTGETLSQLHVSTFDDLIKYTPNVTFGNNGPGQGAIFIRGLSAGFAGGQSSATIGNFPNVAVYLDDQSLQFPARNVDIYVADIERVEVLEGPQGTLFGGGAEAGAVRYITNKPKLDRFEGHAEAMYGGTSGGAANNSEVLTLNVPIIKDKLAVRGTIYNERRGGYIDNVSSTFTRSNADPGNYYLNIKPTAGGLCPNGQPQAATSPGFCTFPNQHQINNGTTAGNDFNPVTYTGGRIEALWDVAPNWDILITESLQHLDVEGLSAQYPIGSDFQPLKPLQVTSFVPSYDHDRFESTAWTVHGKLGPLNAVYTGSYLERHIDNQVDYTNYSRTAYGMYYECTGGATGFGKGAATCFSPATYWHDRVKNTHLTNEFRLSTPDTWRIRAIGGVFQETFRVEDIMNFEYKTIPSCNPANLATALAGGQPCVANTRTVAGAEVNEPGTRDDNTGFGEDVKRGYTQLAFFGSVDVDIIPDVLTITGGTRYFNYKEYEVGAQYSTGTGCLNVPNGQCGPLGGTFDIGAHNDHVSYHGFKSRGSVNWKVTPTTLAYFTFSQGFRPGGFSRSQRNVAVGPAAGGTAQFQTPNSYAPDSLDNYEIGIKTSLFDRRLQLNLSAYNMNWKNVQFLFYNPTQLGNTTFGINGPNYNIKGVEAQLTARPTQELTLLGTATYNDNKQTNSPCLVSNIAASPTFGKCITSVKGAPFQNPFGVAGSVAAFSPHFEASGRIRYDTEIGEYKPFAQVGAQYISAQYNQPATYLSGDGVILPTTTFLRYRMPGYATVDASVGVSARAGWNTQLYVTNLTNSHASQFTSSVEFIKEEIPIRPRVFGVRLGYDF
ncbi:TonB-dependent receptor [Glacieibacterium megasporae]|uniref:TonB-dependent receptor n=1 Tax=Glacieibacterium megasporae TaxID=2835787 RepID=UPI001C1DE3E3|nr:TonB-dependent receptor [Polymorphobacter megasporae]UAJ10856.1 TonB-dependent receptor [Polymorphobacter megasporae]